MRARPQHFGGGPARGLDRRRRLLQLFRHKAHNLGRRRLIATSNPALDRFARELRLFGHSAETGEVVREGNDWFLDEFRACVAHAQIQKLDAMIARRQAVAQRYEVALAYQPGITRLDVPSAFGHAYYQYPVFLDSRLPAAEIAKALGTNHGVKAKAIYKPVHREAIFREYDNGTLKEAERMLDRSLCLPMHPAITDAEADAAAAALVAEVRRRW